MDSDDEASVVALSELSTAASTPRSAPSLQEAAERLQEHWEDFAAMAESARGLARLEALQSVLPHVPDGPHGRLMERALLESQDLVATLRCVERAASTMARATQAISCSPAFACGS